MNEANELGNALDKADQDNMKEEELKKEQELIAENIDDGEEGEEGEGKITEKAPENIDDIHQSQFGLLLNSGILRGTLGVVNCPSETIYTGKHLPCSSFVLLALHLIHEERRSSADYALFLLETLFIISFAQLSLPCFIITPLQIS